MPKRRKNPPSLSGLLTLALVGNVSAGLWFSPITAARKVRIEGAPPTLQTALVTILSGMKNEPCLRVNAAVIESKVQALPGIRSATLHRNVFGSAVLGVEPYIAVAKVRGRSGLYLSNDGVMFKSAEPMEPLPELSPPEGYDAPQLAILGAWESKRAAQACAQASDIIEDKSARNTILIAIGVNGSVSLRVGDGALIEFGDTQRLDDKFVKLRELVSKHPQLFAENSSINLVEPNRPKVVPKK